MLHINNIEPNHRGIQPHIRFRDFLSEIVWALGRDRSEVGFDAVEGGKERGASGFVGGGGGCEARFVDTVVDCVVGPFIGFFDFLPQTLWK
jgi:hypothetical protein